MDPEQKQKIIKALNDRGANRPCPRCGNHNFTLIDGYFNSPLQPKLDNSFVFGGPSIPSIGVICVKCGYIAHHAIGVLGLMPEQPKDNEETSAKTE